MLQAGYVSPSVQMVGKITPRNCDVISSNYFGLLIFSVGAEWARYQITPTGPNPSINPDPAFSLTVAFPDGFDVYQTLAKISDRVSTIIDDLARLIP